MPDTARDVIARAVEPLIDAAVFRVLPDARLTPEGFISAAVLSFGQHGWRVSDQEARIWLEDYIGAAIGADGYEWSARAAASVVGQYVSDFGEPSNA